MLTLYHAPNSRSSVILALIEDMGISDEVNIVEVSVARADGSGGADPRNPHPEKKVPYLTCGRDPVRERGAIIIYLTDMFPESGLGRPVGHPERGAYLSWLFYYQGVFEPVMILDALKIEHPMLRTSFRDFATVTDRLSEALSERPFLLGDSYSAVDLLLSSPFFVLPDALPDCPNIRAWVARCGERPAVQAVRTREQALL